MKAAQSACLPVGGTQGLEATVPASRPRQRVATIAALVLGAAAFVCSATGCTTDAAVKAPASGLNDVLDVPADERCDFYIFTHIGSASQLDECEKNFPLMDGVVTDSEGKAGILVLWVMPKAEWKVMLQYIHQIVTAKNMTAPHELVQLDAKCRSLMEEPTSNSSIRRVRVLSPLDFTEPLLAIRNRLGHERFQKWLGKTTYDAPKLVGSIMRLRTLGNNMPVFRFDVNVLFSDYTVADSMASIKRAISNGVDDFFNALADIRVKTFVLSQQYMGMKATEIQEFNAWNKAYSTRPNPALLATEALVNASQWKGSYTPEPKALEDATRVEVMMQFYGVFNTSEDEFLQPRLPSNDTENDILALGNTYIGANPTRALVSGAALCTGPGTTLDMPPYVHSGLNIMWIDDHILDRSMQEIMGTKRWPRPLGAGAPGAARVVKFRSQPRNPALYTLGYYMPTLLYGVIMDAWVNNASQAYLLKYNPTEVPSELVDVLHKLMPEDGHAQGTATRAMQQVRRTGAMLDGPELKKFKAEMWHDALERIKDTYYQWVHLPEPHVDGVATPTFASLWIAGRVCAHPGLELCCKPDSGCPTLAPGLVRKAWDEKARTASLRKDLPKLTKEDLLPEMSAKVDELIDTIARQLEWMLLWPTVVQAVRGEVAGHLASDVTWHSGLPYPEERTASSIAFVYAAVAAVALLSFLGFACMRSGGNRPQRLLTGEGNPTAGDDSLAE